MKEVRVSEYPEFDSMLDRGWDVTLGYGRSDTARMFSPPYGADHVPMHGGLRLCDDYTLLLRVPEADLERAKRMARTTATHVDGVPIRTVSIYGEGGLIEISMGFPSRGLLSDARPPKT